MKEKQMINLLEDYIHASLPGAGNFSTNPSLEKKVSKTGKLLPFYGNTTVFLLDREAKTALKQLQEELYLAAGELLAERLEPDTLHMTLHDLENGPVQDEVLTQRMTAARQKAKAYLKLWQGRPPLRMRATCLFNMVNTSVVLGLAPADGESRAALAEMYGLLETVVPLGYGLTPHITMAYYKPGVYSQRELRGLKNALHPVQLEFRLNPDALAYQEFTDMNHYLCK